MGQVPIKKLKFSLHLFPAAKIGTLVGLQVFNINGQLTANLIGNCPAHEERTLKLLENEKIVSAQVNPFFDSPVEIRFRIASMTWLLKQ
jgi:hypothetical protein